MSEFTAMATSILLLVILGFSGLLIAGVEGLLFGIILTVIILLKVGGI